MKDQVQKLFLELLCAAIWHRPANSKMFENLDSFTWKSILQAAIKQSSGPLIADKILSLPKECLPPIIIINSLIVQVQKAEEMSVKMNSLLLQVSKEYTQMGIPFAVIKGPANAQNYPKPLIRSCGDLDLYIYQPGDYDKANNWVKQKKLVYHIDYFRDGHMAFEMNGFMVENHRDISFFEINKYNNLLQAELQSVLQKNSLIAIKINDVQIKTLPTEINAFYIFLHMFFHFIHEGVSFRQLCDWILFLSKHHNEINKESFTKLAKSFNLLYPMQLFALTAVNYLQASPEIFPFQLIKNKNYPKKIFAEIWDGGNFGFYHSDFKSGIWNRRWKKFRNTLVKAFRFGGMAPTYALVIPVMSLINRVKLTFKNKWH